MDNKPTGYKTRQRELVLEYLKNHAEFHSADEIIAGLASEGHAVSKPTVYRTLERFVSDGAVTRTINNVGESALYRFAAGHENHFHMKCESCKRTVCIEGGIFNNIEERLIASHGFAVSRANTVLHGTCADCRKGKI